MTATGLHVDARLRGRGAKTFYVRGRLLSELRELLRDMHPEVPGGGMVNLTRHFGITSRAQAENWVRHHHGLIMARRAGHAPRLTLARAVDRYEEFLRAPRERPYADSTVKVMLLAARRVRDQLGPGRLVDTVRESDLERALAAVVAGSSSAETRKNARSRTRALFLTLLDHGLVPLLSYEAIRRAFRSQRGGLSPKTQPRWLRPREVQAVLSAVDGHPLEHFVRLLLLAGPRKHSALALRWEPGGPEEGYVDLEARMIHFWAAKTRSFHVWRLAWSPSVEGWLHDQPRDHELVFGGLTDNRASYLLRASKREGGVMTHPDGVLREAVPGVKLKDLRSTAATYLHCASGIPGGTLEKAMAMGHSPNTAARKYVNPACMVDPAASTMEQALGIEPTPRQEGGRLIKLA